MFGLNRLFKKKGDSKSSEFFIFIHKTIGGKPTDINIYKAAFTHSSLPFGKSKTSQYERLEFLGDSVLSTVISEQVYLHFPNEREGFLSKMRSKLVNRKILNQIGTEMDLGKHIRAKLKLDQIKDIYGNVLEALIGAIYLDKGFEFTQSFILNKIIDKHIDFNHIENKIDSFKGFLFEWAQKKKKKIIFDTKEEENGSKGLFFTSELKLDNETISKGRAKNKKSAEEIASKRAYYKLVKSKK